MNTHTPFLLLLSISLMAAEAQAQVEKPVVAPAGSGIFKKVESRTIVNLRTSLQQIMLVLASSSQHNFKHLQDHSTIFIGDSEEESLQYMMDASRIIHETLVEKLPSDVLLDEIRYHHPTASPSTQGMIMSLQKDIRLYRAQLATVW